MNRAPIWENRRVSTVPPTPPVPPAAPARRASLKEARALAARALNRLERSDAALRLAVTGETRRMEPAVARVDLLATAHEAAPLLDALAAAPFVADVLDRGAATGLVRAKDGLLLHLEVLEQEERFGAALLRTTGPDAYVASLHAVARGRGLAWTGDVLAAGGEERLAAEEHDVYAALDLPWQPPERRGRGSLEEGVPPGLLEMRDVVGVAGLEPGQGPGRYSAAEFLSRAEREGYAWALVTSSGDAPALPLGARRVDIGPDGALTLESGIVADPEAFRIGYPEPGFPTARRALTAALVTAAKSGALDVLALRLPPGAEDPEARALLDACAASGVALGVPPPPHHPRPEPHLLEAGAARGVPVLLLAEAIDLNSVDDLILAVGLARRAGVPRSLVLNTFDRPALEAWKGVRRARARGVA
jgi:DNA polymerase (family 10)